MQIKPTAKNAQCRAKLAIIRGTGQFPVVSPAIWIENISKRSRFMGEKGSKKDKEKANKQKQQKVEKKKEEQKSKLPAKKPA